MPVSPRVPIDPLLDPAQVAALLGVELGVLARWAEAGKLRPVGSATGPRRYLQTDVLRVMVDVKRVQKSAAARAPGLRAGATGKRTKAVTAAEAALDVALTAGAVETAALLASDAAARARHGREVAGRAAERVVAKAAAQDAAATRSRADAAAARVRVAAERAATSERSTADQDDPVTLRRVERMAAAVEAAAAAIAGETVALAQAVAQSVAMTAARVAATRVILDRAIEAEVAATAVAVELRALAAAHLAAADVDVRLREQAAPR
jgi:hypothetical protein